MLVYTWQLTKPSKLFMESKDEEQEPTPVTAFVICDSPKSTQYCLFFGGGERNGENSVNRTYTQLLVVMLPQRHTIQQVSK